MKRESSKLRASDEEWGVASQIFRADTDILSVALFRSKTRNTKRRTKRQGKKAKR